MPKKNSLSRRHFIRATASLTIGFPLLGGCGSSVAEPLPLMAQELPRSLERHPQIQAWLKVLEDGRVQVYSGKVELGQGIRIAIKQVAAEELDLDLDQVEVVLAETGRTPNEGYTAGSNSIQGSAMSVRIAAAAARQRLLELAAEQLEAPVDQLEFFQGRVRHLRGQKELTLTEILNGRQIEGEVKLPVRLKSKSEYRYVGKAIPREDTKAIASGAPVFVHDLRFPGMLHARVLRPKNYRSELVAFDEKAVKKALPGIQKIVRNGHFLGVITESAYEAERALSLLQQYSQWTAPTIFPAGKPLPDHLKSIADPPKTVAEQGEVNPTKAQQTFKASYFKPYIMHAALGPACAVAVYEEDSLHVWTHSQGIYPLREALASMLKMPEEQIHLIGVPGAGCFGHTVADDAAADAALLALAYPGRHIKLQWSRTDEHQWEPYGSAMIMDVEAGLNESGRITFWRTDLWSDSHSTRPNKEAATLVTARYLETPFPMESRGYLGGGHRNAEPYYQIPGLRVDAHFFDGPLRVSSLRSLGAYANIFAIECTMDQLADLVGQDPIAFRLAHSTDPRAVAVIRKVQELTSEEPLASREGIGYAFSRYKNNTSYCAVAAKVATNTENGDIRLLKMWAAVDVGEVINLDGIKNQVEGSLVQAASWTLLEAVEFDESQITSKDWISYPTFRLKETPEMEIAILDRPDEPAMGGGEVAIPPTGAAIANAVFRSCGQRIYHLPLRLTEG